MANVSEMSNQELFLKKNALENEYEVVKTKIDNLYGRMDDIEREYRKVNNELNFRKG